ncbi:MAG: CinA family protein [Alphaproteobacteria bacterium]|nr:CinA family protein [Alphaproteobacteria bacterium]
MGQRFRAAIWNRALSGLVAVRPTKDLILSETETLSPLLANEVEEATRRLLDKASERDLTLATAESCTGGMLASLLTDVQGVAHAFERGFVSYSNEAKNEMLGVPMTLIDTHGAVSREVALAMAEGALSRSRANIALSITGYADVGEEPGLVHFGCARAGRKTAHREEHFGPIGRGGTRLECMRVAVEMMTDML